MLLFVQVVQIARGRTTHESMRGHSEHSSQAHEAITATLVAGTTSMGGAQLTPHGLGPQPAIPRQRHGHARHDSCFTQWKKLLGLNSFVATTQSGLGSHDRSYARRNPFSRGVVTNCKDFWCDPAPYCRRRDLGVAMLDGQVVNYTRLYDMPLRIKRSGPRRGNGTNYESVNTADIV